MEERHICLNFSRSETTPGFDAITTCGFRDLGARYRQADLNVGARQQCPIKANCKLALEKFLEYCHCGPSQKNLVTTHNWDYNLSDARQQRRVSRIHNWLGPEFAADKGTNSGGPYDGDLNPGFLTWSLVDKLLAPLLRGINDWAHDTALGIAGYSTGFWQPYDNHVAVGGSRRAVEKHIREST